MKPLIYSEKKVLMSAGIELGPPAWKFAALTTRPPGPIFFKNSSKRNEVRGSRLNSIHF